MNIRGKRLSVSVQVQISCFYSDMIRFTMILKEMKEIRSKESLQLKERFYFLLIQLSFKNTTGGLRLFRTEFYWD